MTQCVYMYKTRHLQAKIHQHLVKMTLLHFTTLFILLSPIHSVLWSLNIETDLTISNIVTKKGQPLEIPKRYKKIKIDGISGTVYKDIFSKLDASAIVITRNNITEIEDGALCSSPSLKQMEINLDNPIAFNRQILDNCNNLEELAVTFNHADQKVDDGSFQNLPKLKKLVVNNHSIPHLKKDFVKNLPSLTHLVLFNDNVEKIDDDFFENLGNLEEFVVVFHEMTHLPKGLFKSTPKLKYLALEFGNITGLTWDEFEGLSSLETLSLMKNDIRSFDAMKIARHMPKLESYSFGFNPVECKKMKEFDKELSKALNRLI